MRAALLISTLALFNLASANDFFRAAVYEHDRIDLSDARASANANLAACEKATEKAAENGAQLIVFPEYSFYNLPARALAEISEVVPDPKGLEASEKIPCGNPNLYKEADILVRLSCMAAKYKMYIVANYGTKEICEPGQRYVSQICPKKGQFDFNTNVLLGPDGAFLARYRKWNLFTETFDRAPGVETVFIDTPLGRLGLFTCFDILFKSPATDLVEKYKIDTVLYPTWWFDVLPTLTALAVQDGWSWAQGVNLLAANVKRPQSGSAGSGIYSMNKDFIHTSATDKRPRLLIANLPKKPREMSGNGAKLPIRFDPISIDMEANNPVRLYKHSNTKLRDDDIIETLEKISDKRTVCNKNVCCILDYEITPDTFNEDKIDNLKLIARDGLRVSTFKWYEQVCILAEMEKGEIDYENAANNLFTELPTFKFKRIELKGTFETDHVFPIGLMNVNKLIDRGDRQYECQSQRGTYECEHKYKPSKPGAIASFGLYGRIYEKDQVEAKTG